MQLIIKDFPDDLSRDLRIIAARLNQSKKAIILQVLYNFVQKYEEKEKGK
jgi:plasmid stability protein